MHSNSACQRKAIGQFEAALAIYTDLGDRSGQALMLQHLGHCYKALRQFAKAAELFEQALAMQPDTLPSFAHINAPASVFFASNLPRSSAPATYALRPQNAMRRVRDLHPYLAPEQSAFRWGAVPCPFAPTGLAPWVLHRMAHIRSLDYPAMQQQMLDFVDMVLDLSAQQRRRKRACIHSHASNPQLWPLVQVALECRQSVEFWLVFSTVLDYFSEFPEHTG